MNRSDRKLLRRLRAARQRGDPEQARERVRLRLWAKVYRANLDAETAIDAEFAANGEAALAALAAIPDTPELQAADSECLARPPGEGERIRGLLLERLNRMAAAEAAAAPHPDPLPAGGERACPGLDPGESEAKPETGEGEDSSEANLAMETEL